MDCRPTTAQSELECILIDESAEPKALPLSLLEHITNGFCDDREIGYGGFARVYKGRLVNGTVAVKKLLKTVDIDEKKFTEEVRCLMMAKQKNIVRFLGYCYDIQGEMLECEGKLVMEEVQERILCFEYLPKGSLDKYITDASRGLGWSHRYQIISGICDGLYYLHQKCIVHLDLKPSNILLDDHMMPKITDFGLSRCLDEKQSRSITSKLTGTMGYLAPEFYAGRITFKLDIYSLGIIIIEILTGQKGYIDIDNVLKRWRSRLDKKQGDIQRVQLRACTEIAMECTDSNPAKRPDMQHILDRLGTTIGVDKSATEIGVLEKLVPPSSVKILPDFKSLASCTALSGSSIMLWQDRWSLDPLKNQLPHLFSFAKDENVAMSAILQLGRIEDHFNLPLSVEAFGELQQLQMILDSASLSSANDQWSVFGSTSAFKVASAYKSAMPSTVPCPALRWLLLKSCCQSKHMGFFLLLIQDKLISREMLHRKNLFLPDYTCPMCNSALLETGSHLFFECPFAGLFWRYICPSWTQPTSPVHQPSIIDYLSSLEQDIAQPFALEIIVLVCWSIWKCRNDFILKRLAPSIYRCRKHFKDEMALLLHKAVGKKYAGMRNWVQNFV